MNQWVNFCPRCGSKVVEGKAEDEGTIPVRCTNKQCMFSEKGTTLTLHHPIHSWPSSPGDSWALSWIE